MSLLNLVQVIYDLYKSLECPGGNFLALFLRILSASRTKSATQGIISLLYAMGRPSKYSSEEERREARNRGRRDYYARNAENERKRSRARWHRRKGGPQDEADQEPQVALLSTALQLGPVLLVKESTNLKALATCLRFDLTAWRDLTPETQKWSELTEELLAVQRSRRSASSILWTIKEIKLTASLAEDVARDGEREARRRSPEKETEECALLTSLATQAGAIARGTKELQDLFGRGGTLLRDCYKQHALYWQCN